MIGLRPHSMAAWGLFVRLTLRRELDRAMERAKQEVKKLSATAGHESPCFNGGRVDYLLVM